MVHIRRDKRNLEKQESLFYSRLSDQPFRIVQIKKDRIPYLYQLEHHKKLFYAFQLELIQSTPEKVNHIFVKNIEIDRIPYTRNNITKEAITYQIETSDGKTSKVSKTELQDIASNLKISIKFDPKLLQDPIKKAYTFQND